MRIIQKPILCNYYLTYRCNAKCGFCDIWERPSPYATLENVEANLRDLKKLGVKVIDFTGGEPLLHRQLDLFLELAQSMGFITTVTTNALLYPKYAERLKGKVDMLHFSLDSPNEEEHNQSRGVKCFDKLMESISIAINLGERPDILFTVTDQNIHQISEVYSNITQPNGLVLILNPVFEYNSVGTQLSHEDLDLLLDWGKKRQVYLNKGFISLRKRGGNDIKNPVCKAASTSIVISPENKLLLPCYHLAKEAIPIENNLFDIRQSEKVKKAIALEGKLPECQGCVINCYFQPSFAAELNRYWFEALPSTIKYAIEKGTWKASLRTLSK